MDGFILSTNPNRDEVSGWLAVYALHFIVELKRYVLAEYNRMLSIMVITPKCKVYTANEPLNSIMQDHGNCSSANILDCLSVRANIIEAVIASQNTVIQGICNARKTILLYALLLLLHYFKTLHEERPVLNMSWHMYFFLYCILFHSKIR